MTTQYHAVMDGLHVMLNKYTVWFASLLDTSVSVDIISNKAINPVVG